MNSEAKWRLEKARELLQGAPTLPAPYDYLLARMIKDLQDIRLRLDAPREEDDDL